MLDSSPLGNGQVQLTLHGSAKMMDHEGRQQQRNIEMDDCKDVSQILSGITFDRTIFIDAGKSYL